MANVMLKYLKFAQILNRQLSFSSVKYYPGLYLSRSYTNSKFGKSYATAAYKLAVNEDLSIRNNDVGSSINASDLESIDTALSKIDSIIRRNGRTQMKNIEKILSSITSKEVTSDLHALYLLRSCKYCIDEPPSKRIEMVNEIWSKYKELGIGFDARHYNAMLDVHVTNQLAFNPIYILSSMEDSKIELNKDTYLLIMKNYCQDGNISGASAILEYMKEKQMTIDEKVFNYLIEGHINNNDIAGAHEIVEMMRSSNLEPGDDTHAILACGYAVSGDKEKMMSYLKEFKHVDNVQNYLKVIESLASSGKHEYIDDVLSLIEHKEWHHQEFINAAVELIHKNSVEVAYKLVVATYTRSFNEGVNIFVKQLIKVQKKPDEIIQYCKRVQNEGLNPNIYKVAAKAFLEYGNRSETVEFFKKIEKLGYSIRPSSFWSFILSLKENEASEDCWFILKCMSELGIPCDFKTYIEYVYPVMGVPEPKEVLDSITSSGQAKDLAADALFLYYCSVGKLDYALQLTKMFPVKPSNKFDVENFVNKRVSAENVSKLHSLLKYIFMKHDDAVLKCDVQGRLLAALILYRNRLLENILYKYEDLTFSDYALHICEQEISVRSPHKLAVLKKIKVLNAERKRMTKKENLSDKDEDKHINHLKAENLSCKSFLTSRINHHIRIKNIPRVQQLLLIFDELELEYTPLLLCNLLEMWCAAADIDKAKETLDKLKKNFPDFHVDLHKVLDYTTLLMKYGKFDESYEILKDSLSKPHIYSNKDVLLRSINRFNVSLSNMQNNDFVKKLQNLIAPLYKDLGSKKSLVDPLVNMHLFRNDLKSALEEFQKIVITHRVPACLNQFLKKCIYANEEDILQKVIDLTISCTSKSYALLELAVAFIETRRTESAAKVIEHLGSGTDPMDLDNLCVKLWHQDKVNELESLIEIVQPLNHIGKEGLYCHALRACASRNDFQKALQLFEKMKKEDIEPHPETVKILQDLLKKNNQHLPSSLISKGSSEINSLAAEATKTFLEHLEAGNSEAALEELNSLKKGYIRTLPMKTLTDLVDLCLQNNCTHKLSLNVHAMSYIIENVKDVLRPILEKCAEAGDIEKCNLLTSFIPDFSLMSVEFNSYFCKAYISSGKYDELLSLFEEHVTQKNKLFSKFAFEELLKLPEYEEKVFNVAVKYFDANHNVPMTVVWAYYFSKENYEKAEEIYKKYSLNVDKADSIIIKNIKQNENVNLAKKYVDFIKEINVRARIKEKAYGTAVDILVSKGLYDEAANLVVDSEKQNLQLHKYYLSTLSILKSALEKENKVVPFSIPLDKTASGSDSD